jgi:hypothetical protein
MVSLGNRVTQLFAAAAVWVESSNRAANDPKEAIAIAVINAYFEFFDFDQQPVTRTFFGVCAVARLGRFLAKSLAADSAWIKVIT